MTAGTNGNHMMKFPWAGSGFVNNAEDTLAWNFATGAGVKLGRNEAGVHWRGLVINHMQNEFVAFADLDNALYICSLPTCTAGLRSVTFTGEIGAIAMDEVEQRVVVARGAALNYIDWDDLQVPWSNDGTAGSSSRHNADSDLHIIKTSAGSNIQCVAVDARPGHRLAFYSTGGGVFATDLDSTDGTSWTVTTRPTDALMFRPDSTTNGQGRIIFKYDINSYSISQTQVSTGTNMGDNGPLSVARHVQETSGFADMVWVNHQYGLFLTHASLTHSNDAIYKYVINMPSLSTSQELVKSGIGMAAMTVQMVCNACSTGQYRRACVPDLCEACTECSANQFATGCTDGVSDAVCNDCDESCDTCDAGGQGGCLTCPAGAVASAAGDTASNVQCTVVGILDGYPRATRVSSVDGEYDVDVTLSEGTMGDLGGTLWAVVLPQGSAAPSDAQIEAGTDAADAAAPLSGSVSGVDSSATSATLQLSGTLDAGVGEHTLYVAFDSHVRSVLSFTFGEAGERGDGAACLHDAHCDGGLVCASGTCAWPPPTPGVRDVYLVPATTEADCTEPRQIVASLAAIEDGVDASGYLVFADSSDAGARSFIVNNGAVLFGRGDGAETSLTVSPRVVLLADSSTHTFGAASVDIECANLAGSCTADCGDFEAEVSLAFDGMPVATLTDDTNAGGTALAAEVAAELGLNSGSVEFVDATDNGSGGSDVTVGLHLPDGVFGGEDGLRFAAGIDAGSTAGFSLSVRRSTLYHAAGRLLRRAVGSCCTATVASYALAAPQLSPAGTAADGPAVLSPAAADITIVVANAPSTGVVTVHYTTDGSDPTVGVSPSVAFDAGSDTAMLDLSAAGAAVSGTSTDLAVVASHSSGSVLDSPVTRTMLTWRDEERTAPALV